MDVILNLQILDQDQSNVSKQEKQSSWHRVIEVLSHVLAELMAPPAIATVSFFFLMFLGLVSSFYYFNAI